MHTSKIAEVQRAKIRQSKLLLFSQVLYLLMLSSLGSTPSVKAQVTPDGTLSTQVTSSDNQNFAIEGGNQAGNNLFHSFSEFSVPTNGSAVFDNDITVENIFSRVTGDDVSQIDGVIQTNGTANLFLLNPNGILFGENASLNIGGSFVASTAERILFSDTVEFSAVSASAHPLLTVSAPIGLGLGVDPRGITVVGPGHSLRLGRYRSTPIRDSRPVGLQVNTGQTLALIGGDILVEGGNLTANQGRIELGSVSQSGLVPLIPTADGFTFDYDAIDHLGDLRFIQAASVDVSGEGSGNLNFQGRTLAVLEGSAIISNVLGADDGGDVNIRASDLLEIRDDSTANFPSTFFNQGERGSTGQLGDLIFEAGTLRIEGGGRIFSFTSSQGDGGSIIIQANDIELSGASPNNRYVSGIYAAAGSEGDAGSIELREANTLRITDGAQIFSGTFGQGHGGSIVIQANDIELSGTSPNRPISGIRASAAAGSEGNAGSIELQEVNALRVMDGARIVSGTRGRGHGGSIVIQANDIELSGASPNNRYVSGIRASAEADAVGNAGSIELREVNTLQITDGASIFSSTRSQGNGGRIDIQANNIELSGTSPNNRSVSGIRASATTGSEGDAGNIELREANTLRIIGGAQIVSGTREQGNGGQIVIQANDIELSGTASNNQLSGIFASAEAGSGGDAGNIEFQDANTLRVTDGARIVSGTRGRGNGGRIAIRANNIELSGTAPNNNRSVSGIRASAEAGSEGNAGSIELQNANTLRVIDGARIVGETRGQGNGGQIDIQANDVELSGAAPNNRSVSGIRASAEVGSRGDAGSIEFRNVNTLQVTNGARIVGGTRGQGNGGQIAIQANDIELSGATNNNRYVSGIRASAEADSGGNAGNIEFRDVNTLQVTDGARIVGGTRGQGNGGRIDIQANDVELSGTTPNNRSAGIRASAAAGSGGNAGNINVTVGELQVTDKASIAVSSLGEGNAGNLNVVADQVLLTDGGRLESEVAAGEQGNIFLTVDDFLFLRGDAIISANATNQATGGNITIEAPVILGLENSDIIATAVHADGGNIDITTQALLGLQLRDFRTSASDITASSEFGQSGVVTVISPETTPGTATDELLIDFIDASTLIGQSLCAGEGNTFIASGRGGLPASPYVPFNGQATWEDWSIAASSGASGAAVDEFSAQIPSEHTPDRANRPQLFSSEESVVLVEAQGWLQDPQGNVVLTAPGETNGGSRLSHGTNCRQLREILG